MNVQETTEIRELTSDELNTVEGGFLFSSLGVFAAGMAVGYGIHCAGSAIYDWFAD